MNGKDVEKNLIIDVFFTLFSVFYLKWKDISWYFYKKVTVDGEN